MAHPKGILTAIILFVLLAIPAAAQEGPNGLINPNRDCQTLLSCNFTKGGKYRGCVSSYSCRVCRFVRAKCTVGARRGVCEKLVCSWG